MRGLTRASRLGEHGFCHPKRDGRDIGVRKHAVLRTATPGHDGIDQCPLESPLRPASYRNQTRCSASSMNVSSRLAVATSLCSSQTSCTSRIDGDDTLIVVAQFRQHVRTARHRLRRCRQASAGADISPIERNVGCPILRTRSASTSVVAKIWSACSSSSRW